MTPSVGLVRRNVVVAAPATFQKLSQRRRRAEPRVGLGAAHAAEHVADVVGALEAHRPGELPPSAYFLGAPRAQFFARGAQLNLSRTARRQQRRPHRAASFDEIARGICKVHAAALRHLEAVILHAGFVWTPPATTPIDRRTTRLQTAPSPFQGRVRRPFHPNPCATHDRRERRAHVLCPPVLMSKRVRQFYYSGCRSCGKFQRCRGRE